MYPFFIIYAIVDHYRKHITIKIIQAIQSKESTTGYIGRPLGRHSLCFLAFPPIFCLLCSFLCFLGMHYADSLYYICTFLHKIDHGRNKMRVMRATAR